MPIVKAENLTKSYPGVIALNSVDFDLRSGEVHVLFGENGAGKSTLISLLAGSNTPTAGQLYIDDEAIELHSVKDAQSKGIYTVFQEFSLIPTMSVAQNLFLGNEPKTGPFVNVSELRKKSKAVLDDLGFDIDPNKKVSQLSRAQQQMVEIAKALMGNVRVLILDEPTASLTEREVNQLFEFIKNLKSKGVGIIYISHRIQEFEIIADRITVLRDGGKIGTVEMKDMEEKTLVTMMTGRKISEIYPTIEHKPLKAVMKIEGLQAIGVNNTSFEVKAGEVLGFAGLVGSGKSRLWRVIMGLAPQHGGTISYKGKDISKWATRKIIREGIHYLSPDRKNEGLDLAKNSKENLGIDLIMRRSEISPIIKWNEIKTKSAAISDKVELHEGYRPKLISQLSGGNQQKILFGKCFTSDADLVIFDEPTVGVDMGTRAALYQLIKSLSEAGKAVVIISSDLPEVMHLSHRLVVMNQGRIAATLDAKEVSEDLILEYFFKDKEE